MMQGDILRKSMLAACGFGLLLAAVSAYGQDAKILDDDAAAKADVQALRTEANLFEKIKNGVILSLARCDNRETCSPDVNTDEIQRILLKLDSRITTLSTRYQQTSEQGLDQVLLTYADARQGYADALDKLEAMQEGENGFNDAGQAPSGENLNDLFNDTGDDL